MRALVTSYLLSVVCEVIVEKPVIGGRYEKDPFMVFAVMLFPETVL
jgi:hypothetical protein